MEFYWILIATFAICLPMQCLAASLETDNSDVERRDPFGAQNTAFSSSGNQGNFQHWSDWLNKRSFGQNPFGDKNLQAWKEWMDKRGFPAQGAGPNFGTSYGKSFQQWKDWMDKRSFPSTGHEAFKGMPPMDKAQFQTWNDWMIKRGLGRISGSRFGQPSGGNFQSWGEFTKRSDLTKDQNDFLDFVSKRNFGSPGPNNPFSVAFGSNPNMMKWDEMLKRSNEKRRLGGSPKGFGHNKQYFTNGLQDWRNTFDNSKRNAGNAKSSDKERK